ncbi:hypothetical protein, partial [Roseibium sp.]|uniref:hypothetical protein n=1 Tax=Roseibium sp. TaxID=1936156 RepID=UPI003A9768E8
MDPRVKPEDDGGEEVDEVPDDAGAVSDNKKGPVSRAFQTADKPVDFRRVCFLSFCFVAIVRV